MLFRSQVYVPTARPGSRAPHVWLDDGQSTLDLVPRIGFEIWRFQNAPRLDSLENVAKEMGIPMSDRLIDSATAAILFEKKYIIVRPDGHVAWRGDVAPEDPQKMISIISGSL